MNTVVHIHKATDEPDQVFLPRIRKKKKKKSNKQERTISVLECLRSHLL